MYCSLCLADLFDMPDLEIALILPNETHPTFPETPTKIKICTLDEKSSCYSADTIELPTIGVILV